MPTRTRSSRCSTRACSAGARARGELRYWMLETIREFALEQLAERAYHEALGRRHAELFLELAESRGEGPSELVAWVERVEPEHDNLRAAIAWAREADEPRFALRLAAALGLFWELRGYLAEGRARIREALANDPDAPIDLKDQALDQGVMLAFKQGNFATAREWAEELVALAEESGDEGRLARALNRLGIVLNGEERFGEARSAMERSLGINDRLGDEQRVQACAHNLALVSLGEGDFDRAVEELSVALELSRKRGDEATASNDQADRAFALIRLGRWQEARVDAYESLLVASRLRWRENVSYCFLALAAVAVAAGEVEQAARFLGQAARLAEVVQLEYLAYGEQTRIEARQELQSRLPQARLDSLLAEGRAWSIDEAVAAAADPSLD